MNNWLHDAAYAAAVERLEAASRAFRVHFSLVGPADEAEQKRIFAEIEEARRDLLNAEARLQGDRPRRIKARGGHRAA